MYHHEHGYEIGNLDIEVGENQSPFGLTGVECPGLTQIFEMLVISKNSKWMMGAFKPMPPFFKSQFNGK